MSSNSEKFFVYIRTDCKWEVEAGHKKYISSLGSDYGFDFLGNITFDDFVQLVKYKTGMGRKGGISLHYEHPEMHFVIKMVDDSDFGRLKRVIRAVTTPLCIYIMEEEEVVYRRCIGEGSGSKRSSGRGSNNLTGINFAPTLPYYGNLPGYPIIHENLAIEPATYHQAPLDNFELGFDDTDTFLEPNNTNNNVENPEKIHFLNDNEIIPGRNAGNPEEDFFLGSDTEINDSEDQPLGDDYSEGYKKNYFHNMPEAPAHDPVSAPVSSVRLDYRETIKVHQLFQSKHELIDSLGVHAICQQKQFKTVKSTKSRFDAKCIDTNCGWHIHATRVEHSDFFQLRTYNGKHTCSSTQLNPNHRQATKRVLAKFVAEVYTKNPNRAYTGKGIVADINLRYKIQITYHQAWRAKKFALELLRGTHEESFAKLPVYCHNLKIHNPGTVTYIQTDELERFKFIYVSLGASVR